MLWDSGLTSSVDLVSVEDSRNGSFVHLHALVVFNQNSGENIETAECWNTELVVQWKELWAVADASLWSRLSLAAVVNIWSWTWDGHTIPLSRYSTHTWCEFPRVSYMLCSFLCQIDCPPNYSFQFWHGPLTQPVPAKVAHFLLSCGSFVSFNFFFSLCCWNKWTAWY